MCDIASGHIDAATRLLSVMDEHQSTDRDESKADEPRDDPTEGNYFL